MLFAFRILIYTGLAIKLSFGAPCWHKTSPDSVTPVTDRALRRQ
jgi:hypothetical protein